MITSSTAIINLRAAAKIFNKELPGEVAGRVYEYLPVIGARDLEIGPSAFVENFFSQSEIFGSHYGRNFNLQFSLAHPPGSHPIYMGKIECPVGKIKDVDPFLTSLLAKLKSEGFSTYR